MSHTSPAIHANCDQSTHLERCQPVCFIEQKMPVIPTFPENTLPRTRAETLPNLWPVCDSPLGANDGQHLEHCQPMCFIEQKMPVIPTFPENTLPRPRAETLPNLWPVCDSPLGANDGQSKDMNLMTIAMPDAFSLSKNEIAARLRLAAPCTYED